MHSWEGYKQFAWGDDELLPESREGKKVGGRHQQKQQHPYSRLLS